MHGEGAGGSGGENVIYEKGDKALYMGQEECIIAAKHMDDFPNLYYTIKLLADNREKQTTSNKLSRLSESLSDKMLPKLVKTKDNELEQKLTNYLKRDKSLTETIRTNKEFGNPQILRKTVNYFGIKETSSNYPKHLYDPEGYREGFDFEDDIRKRSNMAPQAAPPPTVPPPQTQTKAAAVLSGLPISNSSNSSNATISSDRGTGLKRRKSNWDDNDGGSTPVY